MPTAFITAASGKIGSRLIPILLETTDVKLVLPTSNAEKLSSKLPKSDRVTVVEGSIQDPQWVETQFKTHNVDTVFLVLTGTDELFTTMNFYSAIQRTPSMKHIVYLSACVEFTSGKFHTWKCSHGLVKGVAETALRELSAETGVTHTILGPTLFFDNDMRMKDGVMKAGVFAEPLGPKGAGRIAVEDIAEAAKIAIVDQGQKWNGKKIVLSTKEKYTEDDISKLWTEAVGKPIKSAPSDDAGLDELEGHFKGMLDPAWARDLRLMYEGIRATGFGPTDEEYAETVKFLGREPASYPEYVHSLVKSWK